MLAIIYILYRCYVMLSFISILSETVHKLTHWHFIKYLFLKRLTYANDMYQFLTHQFACSHILISLYNATTLKWSIIPFRCYSLSRNPRKFMLTLSNRPFIIYSKSAHFIFYVENKETIVYHIQFIYYLKLELILLAFS